MIINPPERRPMGRPPVVKPSGPPVLRLHDKNVVLLGDFLHEVIASTVNAKGDRCVRISCRGTRATARDMAEALRARSRAEL